MMYQTNIIGMIDQGDILYPIKVKDWLPWWIDDKCHPIVILTPTCDIAQEKVDFHRFTVLQPFPLFFLGVCQEVFGNGPINLSTISKTKKERIKNKLERTIRNAWPRYHFLSKEQGIFETNRFIDFEVVISVPIEAFSPDLRIARLKSPYKEELIHRYSHHTMRIGTEDIPKDIVTQIIDNCFALPTYR